MKRGAGIWLPGVLVMILLMGASLACGGSEAPTPRVEVLVITATFTPETKPTATLAPTPVVNALPEASPTAPPPAPLPGVISGRLCYPSEYIPAMTIYARNADTGETWTMHVPMDTLSYEFEVPAGDYLVFAWTDEGLGGSYSEFVPCGLSVECSDHTPVVVPVAAGQRVTGVDICDFYMEEAVPRP